MRINNAMPKYKDLTKSRASKRAVMPSEPLDPCEIIYRGSYITELTAPKKYIIDFNKVNDLNDIKVILSHLFNELPITVNEGCNNMEQIKKYLVEYKEGR